MSGLSVAGIASGIDTDNIISQMVAFESRGISTIQRRIAEEEAERTLFQDINSRLQSLQGAVGTFSADNLFSTLSSSSSNTDLLTVSATSDAPLGTHRVQVLQLATSHRLISTGVESRNGSPVVQGFSAGHHVEADSITKAVGTTLNYAGTTSNVNFNTYTGENQHLVIKVSDQGALGQVADGDVKVRVSTDGGTTFGLEKAVTAAGNFTLDDGIVVTLDLGAGDDVNEDDQFQLDIRAKPAFEFKVGADGATQRLTLDSEMTLESLVTEINRDSTLGIRADILNDGTGSNPHRLILTSLTEGRTGQIMISHSDMEDNGAGDTIVGFQVGATDLIEDPFVDSSTYEGEFTLANEANYNAEFGNNRIVIEFMESGDFQATGTARFRISTDGGLNFDDNNGNGFAFDSDGTIDLQNYANLTTQPNFNLNFTNNGTFSVGDRVEIDFFNPELEAAQDALLNVNGLNLVKSSNTVDDVFEGLTLNLEGADTTETVTVRVEERAGDITAAMGGFVEAYNNVMSVLNAQSSFDPDSSDPAPLLIGDSTVRQIRSNLQRYVSGRISILGSSTLSSLGEIGVSTDSETGLLSLNTATLATAINSDPEGVRRLLSRFGETISGSNIDFVSSTTNTQGGTYEVNVTQARTRATVQSEAGSSAEGLQVGETETITFNFGESGSFTNFQVSLTQDHDSVAKIVSKIQEVFDNRELALTATTEVDGNGHSRIVVRSDEYGEDFTLRVESSGAVNRTKFATGDVDNDTEIGRTGVGTELKAEINGISVNSSFINGDEITGPDGFAYEGLKVKVSNDFSGNAGTIRLTDGLGSSMASLLDGLIGNAGTLTTRIGSFDSIITRLESQITRQQERVSLLEERLRRQFVNLEVTLGQLNSTSQYLEQQLKTLPGVSQNK